MKVFKGIAEKRKSIIESFSPQTGIQVVSLDLTSDETIVIHSQSPSYF